jgi:hypothetical protein
VKSLQFTRQDFNNVLNFYDVRSSEFTLIADGEYVEAEDFTTHLTSNTDVVPDFISARRVKDIISVAKSYIIKVKKPYPCHEALIDDAVLVSNRHLFAYTPVIVAARDSFVKTPHIGDLPTYVRFYEGPMRERWGHNLLQTNQTNMDVTGKNLLVLHRPNRRLQRELVIRMFRKKVRAEQRSRGPIFSLRQRSEFFSLVAEELKINDLSPTDADLFFHTLMQTWPCGARHRLSSYIFIKEKEQEVVAEMITWNTRIVEGEIVTISGKRLASSSAVNEQILEGGVKRSYRFEPSRDVDNLVLEGVLGYRRNDDWRYSGWPVTASGKDPSIFVRSDGLRRWMSQKHGGLESIESLVDGTNKAVGTSFLEKELWHYLAEKRTLFAGLGLGVLQRRLLDCSQTLTVEQSAAVIEIFKELYPEEATQLLIVKEDFFSYLQHCDKRWDTIVIDFFDPGHTVLLAENMASMTKCLSAQGTIIINKQGERTSFLDQLKLVTNEYGFAIDCYELNLDQTVAVLRN